MQSLNGSTVARLAVSLFRSTHMDVKYALITPAHNEEKYIRQMIDSVLAQAILPSKWIIVDDGSTDKTAQIVEAYKEKHSFMEVLSFPERQRRLPGGESAVGHALRQLNLEEYDFLARFDSDVVLQNEYITQILSEFRRDERLGIAGGGLYVEKNNCLDLEKVPACHVRGALKMYRRECFHDIGGLSSRIGWDTIDEVYAWMRGWRTQSFFEYSAVHLRPTGEGVAKSRIYWERGKADYYTWSHPLFVLAKTVKIVLQTFSLVKAACFLAGFASCYAYGEDRLQDPLFAKIRRKQQRQRIFLALFGDKTGGL